MKFDLIAMNPPFQDSGRRGKTPHKLWIEFTLMAFDNWLAHGGYLAQVSPSSFRSPNSEVLEIMRKYATQRINFDSGEFFPGVGSSFADFIIQKIQRTPGHLTTIKEFDMQTKVEINDELFYLPNRIGPQDLSIHKRVMYQRRERLDVRWDYVTCHNIRLRTAEDLSKTETNTHRYPVLHTNRQIWWSAVRQPFADKPKVLWSRSGYTKPFFDPGKLGGTDMVYYVLVGSKTEGIRLEKILNSQLFQYIFSTAKWSGFGNERVFRALPKVEISGPITDHAVFDFFELTKEEREYVESFVG